MIDPVKFKKILVNLLKILVIVELVTALAEGSGGHGWGRFGIDLVIAGILYLTWERLTAVVNQKREESWKMMQSSPERAGLFNALVFSLLWTDRIYEHVPPDRLRLIVISYTLIALGLVAASLAGVAVPWWIWIVILVLAMAGMSRFMWFLVLFTGYWIVFWQEFISLPGYIHNYIDATAPVEAILITDGLVVIVLTIVVNYLTRRIPAFPAVILGTVISSVAWLILAFRPTIWGAVLSLVVLALGEIIQSPRYYEYISRLAPPGQQGTYMGFAFLPIGIGSLIGGWFGGSIVHHFGEVTHQPARIWFAVTAVGLATAVLLAIYNKIVRPGQANEHATR